MYNFKHNIKERIINIDLSNRCTLKCPGCARVFFKNENPKTKIPGNDVTLEQIEKLANYFNGFDFCGQYSDPIFNPYFIDILKLCRTKNKIAIVNVAASHRPKEWFEKAFNESIWDKCKWVFGIDGLPEESHLYRINQDGEKLFNMMLLAKSKKINVSWQYIPFNYNENHIQEAFEIAKANNINFELMLSNRMLLNTDMTPKNKKFTNNIINEKK